MPDQSVRDLAGLRATIPALQNKRYFNFGGQGAMPQAVIDALMNTYRYVQEVGPFSNAIFHWMLDELSETRAALARELGGQADSWALTSNVTEGCNIVLWGQDWQPGDHLLITDSEHNGVVGAVENIARRLGINFSYFSVANKTPEQILESLREGLRDNTKLVVFSHVLWNTGQTLPIEEMTSICAEHGAQSLVDGAQSAGAVKVDLGKTDADYYAITGHKWMCGPEGLGALWVRPSRLSTLEPTFTGWRIDMTGSPKQGRIDGSRFEVATSPFPLLAGLRAALKVHNDFDNAQSRADLIVRNARELRRKLESIEGVHCFGDAQANSGLVSFAIEGANHQKIVADLEREKLMMRTIPSPDAIRASVHYFSLPEEIDALVEALRTRRV